MSGWDRSEPVGERFGCVILAAFATAATWTAALPLVLWGGLFGSGGWRGDDRVTLALLGAASVAAVGALVGPLRRFAVRALEVTWLAVVPLWGLGLDVTTEVCPACGESPGRPLALPAGLLVFAAYGVALAGWAAHRRRAAPWTPAVEAAVQGALWLGLATTGALAVQFAPYAPWGLAFPHVGLPLLAPTVAFGCFGWAAFLRGRRATDALARGLAAAAALGGADLLLHRALTGGFGLWAGAFARTCGWTFSTQVPDLSDCGGGHYLCTVAAHGHPWLVRPLRTGRRGGRTIVVNRQLAVANAFEDLLHERWPRFGRGARATYDRLARPICRYLRHPLAADAVFLAMLPAQAAFEATLRALDADPEARIDRMYR